MHLLDPTLIASESLTQNLSCELNLMETLQLCLFLKHSHTVAYLQRCQSQQQQMNVHFQRFNGYYPIYAALWGKTRPVTSLKIFRAPCKNVLDIL